MPDGRQILLTDTVGFIRNLPHQFIKAFRSTLDEVRYSDVTVVLMDASDRECTAQAKVTMELLAELKATDKPILYVFNKCDTPAKDEFGEPYLPSAPEGVSPENVLYISAKTGKGVPQLLEKLQECCKVRK